MKHPRWTGVLRGVRGQLDKGAKWAASVANQRPGRVLSPRLNVRLLLAGGWAHISPDSQGARQPRSPAVGGVLFFLRKGRRSAEVVGALAAGFALVIRLQHTSAPLAPLLSLCQVRGRVRLRTARVSQKVRAQPVPPNLPCPWIPSLFCIPVSGCGSHSRLICASALPRVGGGGTHPHKGLD